MSLKVLCFTIVFATFTKSMAMDQEFLTRLWNKASKIDGLNPLIYRKDACGALIMRDKFGMENPFGWVIDHIFPVDLGGDNHFDNLRPLH